MAIICLCLSAGLYAQDSLKVNTKKLDVKKENYAETFSCLLKDATNFLTFMELNIENLK